MTTITSLIEQTKCRTKRDFLEKLREYMEDDNTGDIENLIIEYHTEFDAEVIESIIGSLTPKLLYLITGYVSLDKNQINRLFVVALLKSNLVIAKILLDSGADPNAEISAELYYLVKEDRCYRYYMAHQLRGYLLYRVISDMDYHKLNLLIDYGIDLGMEDGMVLMELSRMLDRHVSDKEIRKFKKIYELLLSNHTFSQKNIVESYATAILIGNVTYANLLKEKVEFGSERDILTNIFRHEGSFYNYHAIMYCINNFDFSNMQDILTMIIKSILLLPSGDIMEFLPKLHMHGANLQDFAVEIMMTAVLQKDYQLKQEIKKYIDVDKCISDIVGKILE